jgi:hypothetical protein
MYYIFIQSQSDCNVQREENERYGLVDVIYVCI